MGAAGGGDSLGRVAGRLSGVALRSSGGDGGVDGVDDPLLVVVVLEAVPDLDGGTGLFLSAVALL